MKKIALISACLLVFASCSGPVDAKTSIEGFTYSNGVASWSSVKGLGVEVKGLNDENFTRVKGNSFTATRADLYTFRAVTGVSGQTKYVSDPNGVKYAFMGVPATDAKVLEDGSADSNADLAEKYTITKYDNGWVPSTATITLDTSNGDISEGKCVKMGVKHHGTYFKYDQDIELDKSYDTFSFYVRGEEGTYYSLAFQIFESIIIDEYDLAGVFISYQVKPAAKQWNKYTVSMSDPNWKIDWGGEKYGFGTIQEFLASKGCIVNSLGDLFPLFDQFQFRVGATYNSSGSNANMWFDEVKLENLS